MAKLTEASITRLALQPGMEEVYLWDSAVAGFGIRMRKGGSSVFVVKYRIGQQQRKVTLGRVVPGMLTEMREMASIVIAKAKLGEDVQAGRKAAAVQIRQAVTVGTLIGRYLEMRRPEWKERYAIEVDRHLRKQAAPLHTLAIEAVTRREIVGLIDNIAETSGRTAADRVKASVSAFLVWCIERNYIDANPAMGIKRRAESGSRERVLTEVELVAIWKACGEDDHGRIVRLLMLTGQRRDEFGSLAWGEVDFDARQILLPGERTKNGRAHAVPLSDAAVRILDAIPRRGDRTFVFGRGNGGFSGWSQCKQLLDAAPAPRWRKTEFDDLRRTFATLSADHEFRRRPTSSKRCSIIRVAARPASSVFTIAPATSVASGSWLIAMASLSQRWSKAASLISRAGAEAVPDGIQQRHSEVITSLALRRPSCVLLRSHAIFMFHECISRSGALKHLLHIWRLSFI